MEHRTDERPSDELPFLADEEKDILTITNRPSLSQRWASLLPYSVLLNVAGVIFFFAFLAEPRRDPRLANNPNEIYCTRYTNMLQPVHADVKSPCSVCGRIRDRRLHRWSPRRYFEILRVFERSRRPLG